MKRNMKLSVPLAQEYLGAHDRAKLEEVAKALAACTANCGLIERVTLEIWETVRIYKEAPVTYVEILATFEDDQRWWKRNITDATINNATWLTYEQKEIVSLFYFAARRLARNNGEETIIDVPNAGQFRLDMKTPVELY